MPYTIFAKSMKILTGATLVASMLAAGPVYAVGGSSGGGSSDSGSSSSSDTAQPGVPTLAEAQALIDAKKYKSAVSLLKKIVAAQPRNAEANNLLGYSLRKTGDYKNAQGFYLKALKINPKHRGAHEYLGELYVEIGQMEKAKQMLADLEKLCGNKTCEEYEDLEKFIEAKS